MSEEKGSLDFASGIFGLKSREKVSNKLQNGSTCVMWLII